MHGLSRRVGLVLPRRMCSFVWVRRSVHARIAPLVEEGVQVFSLLTDLPSTCYDQLLISILNSQHIEMMIMVLFLLQVSSVSFGFMSFEAPLIRSVPAQYELVFIHIDFTCHPKKWEVHESRNCVFYLCVLPPSTRSVSYCILCTHRVPDTWMKECFLFPGIRPLLSLTVLCEKNKGRPLLSGHFSSPVNMLNLGSVLQQELEQVLAI